MLTLWVDISRQTVAAAKRAVREYAKEDGIPRRDYKSALMTLEGKDCDWFMVCDAIGTRPPQFFQEHDCDPTMAILYEYAMTMAFPKKKTKRKKEGVENRPTSGNNARMSFMRSVLQHEDVHDHV